MNQPPAPLPADMRPNGGADPEGFVQTVMNMDTATLHLWCRAANAKTTGCNELLMCRVLLNEYHIAKIQKKMMKCMLTMDPQSPDRHEWQARMLRFRQSMTIYGAGVIEVGDSYEERHFEMKRACAPEGNEKQIIEDREWAKAIRKVMLRGF